jgi:hypothetical protein
LRQLVVDGQRWDVFVEPHAGADGREKVAYVFRMHDARAGRPAEERRATGYFTAQPAISTEALLQLFHEAG